MINLSLGLAYVHYGLKRQSSNRQYLLLQGQAFLSLYIDSCQARPPSAIGEAYFNIGRLFHLLGIPYLALEYYSRAYQEDAKTSGQADIYTASILNSAMILQVIRNNPVALVLIKDKLII